MEIDVAGNHVQHAERFLGTAERETEHGGRNLNGLVAVGADENPRGKFLLRLQLVVRVRELALVAVVVDPREMLRPLRRPGGAMEQFGVISIADIIRVIRVIRVM